MHPAHETFNANIFPLYDIFFLVSQKEGLQVGGRVAHSSLARPWTTWGGVRRWEARDCAPI